MTGYSLHDFTQKTLFENMVITLCLGSVLLQLILSIHSSSQMLTHLTADSEAPFVGTYDAHVHIKQIRLLTSDPTSILLTLELYDEDWCKIINLNGTITKRLNCKDYMNKIRESDPKPIASIFIEPVINNDNTVTFVITKNNKTLFIKNIPYGNVPEPTTNVSYGYIIIHDTMYISFRLLSRNNLVNNNTKNQLIALTFNDEFTEYRMYCATVYGFQFAWVFYKWSTFEIYSDIDGLSPNKEWYFEYHIEMKNNSQHIFQLDNIWNIGMAIGDEITFKSNRRVSDPYFLRVSKFKNTNGIKTYYPDLF
eukprot:418025_1